MSELITGITPQEDFPRVDLSEENAELLELMLANLELVNSGHEMGEGVSWMFRVGHPAVVVGLGRIYDKPELLEAIDHGVKVYEAASSFVTEPSVSDEWKVIHGGAGLMRILSLNELDEYASVAMGEMTEQMPRTKELVSVSSKRFYAHLARYAVLGAAMSRRFELDCA